MGKKKQRVGQETRKRVKDAHKERQRELKLSSRGTRMGSPSRVKHFLDPERDK